MPAVSFAQFKQEVLALYRPPQRRPATWAKMEKVLRELQELGVKRCGEITPGLVVRWLEAHSTRRPATNAGYLGSMRAAVNIGKRLGYIRVSPWEVRTRWIPEDLEDDAEEIQRRHLTVAEIGRILAQADAEAIGGSWPAARLQVLVYLYVYAGLRRSEALGLMVAEIDLDKRTISLRSRRSRRLKTRSSRRLIAIHPELCVVLQRWLPRVGSEWLIPTLRRQSPWLYGPRGQKALDQVRDLGVRAGVEGVTIQAFRRSLATHAKLFGLGPMEVQDLLGHTSVNMQLWYVEDDLDDQRAAVAKIVYRVLDAET